MNVELAHAVRLRRVVLCGLRIAILTLVAVGAAIACTRIPEFQLQYTQSRSGMRSVPWLSDFFTLSATLLGLAFLIALTQRWLVPWLVPLPRPICPACGYTLTPSARLERCPECGLQISSPAATAPSPAVTPERPAPPSPRS